MDGNQSGAEKDNRLLFSKSKMAATNFIQSGGELRIQMAVAAWKPGNEVPDSNRSLFRGEKIANRTRSPGISLFTFFPLGYANQSTHMYIK